MRHIDPVRVAQSRWDVIIGILLGVMMITLVVPFLAFQVIFPPLVTVRGSSCDCQTINNLKQMSLALHSFNDVHKRLPPAFDKSSWVNFEVSLHVQLLPFIEQEPLFKAYVAKAMPPGKTTLDDETVSPFLNPCDWSIPDSKGWQNFGANLRVFSTKGFETSHSLALPPLSRIEPGTGGIPRSFTDGTSNSIVFSTRFGLCGNGGSRYAAAPDSPFGAYIGETVATIPAAPADARATFLDSPRREQCMAVPFMAHSFQKRGLMIGLGDGSVRVLAPSISPETWNRAMQPNDGLVLGSDW